ncbi:MAG TPA: D-alanyl-D-alanine carboxypeptidase/D-alanyl-D-alanine-endopeptidase [Pseudonocardiaceae bacterium]
MPGLGRRIGDTLHLPARRGKRIAVIGTALLVAVALGAGVGLGTPAIVAGLRAAGIGAPAIAPPPPPVVPRLAVRPAATDGPAPTAAGIAAVLDPLADKGGFGTLSGRVVDPDAGTVLWQRSPSTALTPGSTAKLLTVSAALLTLDHNATFHTKVVAGAQPGTVVLVGGGDPTLSSEPAGVESVYPGAARLDDLVAQVRAASPVPVRQVLVDVSRYSGDAFAPGWSPGDVAGGDFAPIEPVMLDGGRADPRQVDSPRAAHPASAAAAELARRLGADPGSVAVGTAPPGARVLGDVSSASVEELVTNLLNISDNVLAEALARQVAIATGAPPSFSGASSAVLSVLRQHGFHAGGTTMVDGSGLSVNDAVSAELLTELLSAAAGPDTSRQRTVELRPLLGGLPVAGGTGTLADRYEGSSAEGRGWVRAKTGTLTGVSSLAGTVLDADGRVLVFALLSNGPNPADVRPRLDTLAAALRPCGCR